MEKTWIKSCIGLFVALLSCGIAVTLLVGANLGSDTITVVMEGISKTFHLSLGNASRIFDISFLVLSFLFARKEMGWCTIAYALLVGFSIDLYEPLLVCFKDLSLFYRILCLFIGQICFIITFSILILIGSGMNHVDALAYAIERITNIPFKYIRTSFDILFIVFGYLMGGVVGIGSVFTMMTTGYGIDLFLKICGYKKEKYEEKEVL